MERNPEFSDGDLSLLVIELGEQAIKSQLDCMILWDELESIAEDFPGYLVVAIP